MNPNICNNCGGDYEYRRGRWICRSCGAYKPEELSNEEVTLLYTAYQKLRLAEFAEAEREFDDILQKYSENPNAYWGRLMAKYGIKYEQDFDGRMIPTCYAASIESVLSSSDYQKALQYADEENKAYYRRQAEYIERVRKEWIEKARKEKPYDIFICYKDSDLANGIERTQDSIAAQDLYIHLRNKGYRVFYSHESLRDKAGEKYEPYIFNALSTAKVMIVYGSKPEYITSTWLKNEWTRYEKRMQKGEKNPNSLLVAYEGFSPNELPTMLSSMICLDAGLKSFYSELDDRIEKILRGKNALVKYQKKKKALSIAALFLLLAAMIGFGVWSIFGGTVSEDPPNGSETDVCEHLTAKKAAVSPTCTENGLTEGQYCPRCGEVFVEQKIIPAAHKPGPEADCTNAQKCTICRYEIQAALGHTPGEEATCTSAQKCDVCDTILQTALGHKPNDWITVTEATDLKNGLKIKKCSVCDETLDEEIIPMTIAVGQTVIFGSYEQDGDTENGKEAIEWIVLDIQDGRALVISKYALDCQKYHTYYENVTWETCSLRQWLNDDFINAAFSEDEQTMIPTVTVPSDYYNATQDQIFLLSVEEANQYFSSNLERACKITDYTRMQGAYTSSTSAAGVCCRWFLRSTGSSQTRVALVTSDGSISQSGNYVNYENDAVRPALWIDLNA